MGPMAETTVLLVEDNPTDALLLQEALADAPGAGFELHTVGRLAAALERLENESFDVVIVDLGLPDSSGLQTLRVLHEKTADIPTVVMTGAGGEEIGIAAMQIGAQDYIVKSELQAALLPRVIRYAVERRRLQKALDEARAQESRERELRSIQQLSKAPATSFTAEIYDGRPLCQSAPEDFFAAVARYEKILDLALERHIHKSKDTVSGELTQLSDELGFLRAGPRDVLEIHSSALNKKVTDCPPKAAQVYMDEGRVTVLELMGHLASHYRHYFRRAAKDRS